MGALLLVWAIRTTIRWRKFGRSYLELWTLPGVVGGKLEGRLHVERLEGAAGESFDLKLTCFESVTTGSGKNRSTTERILWRDERSFDGREIVPDLGGAAVPVSFRIPFSCRPSDDSDPGRIVHWVVELDGVVPGVDYLGLFDVPVFKTGASRSEVDDGEQEVSSDGYVARSAAREMSPALLESTGIVVGPSRGGGTEFYFRPARNPGAAVGLTIFAMIWSGAVALIVHLDAPFFFAMIFGGVDVLLIFGVIVSWLGTTRVTFEDQRIRVVSGVLGIGRSGDYRRDEIEEVRTRIGTQQTSGNTGTVFYDVFLALRSGGQVPAGGSIGNKRVAEWIAAKMNELR